MHPNTAHYIPAELPQRRKPDNINTAPWPQSSGERGQERREQPKNKDPAGKRNFSGKKRKFLIIEHEHGSSIKQKQKDKIITQWEDMKREIAET